MNCLPDVWRKVEKIAEKFERIYGPEQGSVTYTKLIEIRDDLLACADAVQTVLDKSF